MAKMGRPKAESPKKKNVSFRMTKEEYEIRRSQIINEYKQKQD